MSALRSCEIREEYVDPKPGFFHQWGSTFRYGEGDQTFAVTFAIVELQDGKVMEVAPSKIKFTDR